MVLLFCVQSQETESEASLIRKVCNLTCIEAGFGFGFRVRKECVQLTSDSLIDWLSKHNKVLNEHKQSNGDCV